MKSRKQALLKGRRRRRRRQLAAAALIPSNYILISGHRASSRSTKLAKSGFLSERGRGRTSLLRASSRRVNVHRRMARENEPERRRARGPLLN